MIEPAPPAGETRRPSGSPWASADPDATWWHSDTETHPTITRPAADPDPDPDNRASGPAATDDDATIEAAVIEAALAGTKAEPEDPDTRQETDAGHDPDATQDADAGQDDGGGSRLWPDLDVPDLITDSTGPTSVADDPAAASDTGVTVPGQSRPGQSRPGQSRPVQGGPGHGGPAESAAARAARGRSAHVQTLLETSPFWLGDSDTEREAAPPAQDPSLPASRLGVPPRRRPRAPRKPAFALSALVALALIAAFFAWVSAEPLWLALGHGHRGTATVTRCTGAGVGQRCTGQFTTTDARLVVPDVTLLGIEPDQRAPGAVVPASMVNQHSRRAFVGADGLRPHLRWIIGLLLVLLSGVGIAATTGARRLETLRARRTAVLLSLAGPVALLAGFLAITY